MSLPPPPLPREVLPYQTGIRCPKCGAAENKKVSFTWWGGAVGPMVLSHVKCLACGQGYNGKTGRLNTTAIVWWNVIGLIVGIGLFVLWQLYLR